MDDVDAIRRLRVAGAIAIVSIALLIVASAVFLAWRYSTAPARSDEVNRSGLRRGQSIAVAYQVERLARFPDDVALLDKAIDTLEKSQAALNDLNRQDRGYYGQFIDAAKAVAAHPRDDRLRAALESLGPAMYDIYFRRTNDYAAEAAVQRARSFGTTMAASAVTLLVLVLLYIFVIRPSEKVVANNVRELEERRQRFRSLFEASPNAIVAFTPEGTITEVNLSTERLTGYRNEDLVGKHVTMLVAPEFRENAAQRIASVLGGDARNYRLELLARDGTRVSLEADILPIRIEGRSEGVFLIGKDLTREEALASLDQRDERMRALYRIASTPDVAAGSQVDEALALGAEALGMEYGFVSHVEDGIATIEHRLAPDGLLPLHSSLASVPSIGSDIVASPRAKSVHDMTIEPYARQLAERGFPWKCFIGCRVAVEHAPYGLLVFFRNTVREPGFDQSDRDFIDLMSALIGSALGRLQLQAELSKMAFHDTLTGLPNRALLEEHLSRAVMQAQRSKELVALHYLDLNRFKPVNDEHGHAAGDQVLRESAKRFASVVRAHDVVARIGGDEFVVLQTGAREDEPIRQLAQRLRSVMNDHFALANGAAATVGVSVGTAVFPRDAVDASGLLRAADSAMYGEKSARGRAG